MSQNIPTDPHRDEMKRAAFMSLALTGGAIAALALAKYLANQPGGRASSRISLGGANGASLDSWLRDTAEKLQHGSQSLLTDLDKER